MRNPKLTVIAIVGAIGATATFISTIGGATNNVTKWWREIFPTSPPNATSTAFPPTTLGSVMSSLDIGNVLPGSLDGYTFEENGQPFNYHEPPAREGFLVQYHWIITGIGWGDLYYSIEDDSVKPADMITPLIHVGRKINNKSGSATNEETDFFAETGVPRQAQRLTLVVTCMITLADNSATQTSQTLRLADASAGPETVVLR